MFINDEKARHDCDMILGALRFKRNYRSHSALGLPIVIVEGAIDRTFYDLHKQDNVLFITISELSKNIHIYETDNLANNNVLIAEILYNIQNGNYSTKDCKGDFYGIIDKDFEEKGSIVFSIPNLFITDTHDLETVLLSSDAGLLQRMGIELTDDEYEDAILLSYELGLIKQDFYGNEAFKVKHLLDDDAVIDFSRFVSGKELDVRKVYDYLNSQKAYPFREAIINEHLQSFICRHYNIISSSGIFGLKDSMFKTLILRNAWNTINGHDFCSAIRFISEKAAMTYPAVLGNNKRYMESVMVTEYEFSNFRKSNLGIKMRDAALLRG